MMRYSAAAIAVIGAALVRSAAAQQPTTAMPGVSGHVVESGSGAPIVSARVELVEARRSDLTHDDGTFKFPRLADGKYTVRILRIGLQPFSTKVTVSGGSSTPLSVTMSPAVLQLDAVVSTGTIAAKAAKDVLSPTTVVGEAQLDRQLQSTIAGTLKNQPGVTMSTLGPATAHPVIRGLQGNRVVMLEDGARSGDLSSTSNDHAVTVDPNSVKQIEVVRGPMSLLYGSSALGGVVNAIREEVPTSRSEHASGALNVEGSSVDMGTSGGGYVGGSFGSIGVRAEGTARRSGDLKTPRGLLEGTSADTYSGAIAGSVIGAAGYGGGSYRYYNNSYGVPGGFVGGHNQSVHIDMRRHVGRGEAELRGRGPFSSVKAIGTYTDYSHEEIEHGGSLGTSFTQQVTNANVIARHTGIGLITEGAIGANWQYRDIHTGGTVRTPSTYDNSAAFFAVEEAAAGKFRLQGGLRYDWARYTPHNKNAVVVVNDSLIPALPRTFGSVSGSLGTLYDVANGVQLGASVSRAYRTPDFNELYSNGPHLASFSFDVGNPTLRQETGVGLDAFARIARERVRGEIAVFRNRMDDYIFPRPTGDLGLQGNRPKFQFTGRNALLTGIEGNLEVSVLPRLVLDGTASFVRGTFLGFVDSLPPDSAHMVFASRPGSHYIPFMPPLTGHVGARYEAPKWFASTTLRLAATQNRLGDFETTTPGYGVLDADAGIRMFDGRRFHAVTLRIENALDQTYYNHLARTKEIAPEAGRNLALVYRVTF
jgi:iron complex outermembrane receptor protein